MAIAKELWNKARALFELGKSLSEISKLTGIARSGISMKATKEKWDSQKLNTIAIEKIKAVNDLHEINNKIEQLPSKIEQQIVQQEIDQRLAIFILNSLTHFTKRC